VSVRRVIGGVAATVALALTGCGSSSPSVTRSVTSSSGPVMPPPAGTPAAQLPPAPGGATGRRVFGEACLACHSISGHSAASQQGGDLRSFRSSRDQLRELTAEMPVLHHRLSRAELSAVVAYVAAVEARG
jgi:mono/diheme cytochrome c family protein